MIRQSLAQGEFTHDDGCTMSFLLLTSWILLLAQSLEIRNAGTNEHWEFVEPRATRKMEPEQGRLRS